MTWIEIVSLVLNVLFFGGGIVMLVTLRATKRKADAEARRTVIDNETAAMENFQKYIVEPLKAEVETLRKAVTAYKREVSLFRKAIERVSDCDYKDICPVKKQLKEKEERDETMD